MSSATHTHSTATLGPSYPWTKCVAPSTHHGARPHGNLVREETCRCGAWRLVEVNGTSRKASNWHEPDGA